MRLSRFLIAALLIVGCSGAGSRGVSAPQAPSAADLPAAPAAPAPKAPEAKALPLPELHPTWEWVTPGPQGNWLRGVAQSPQLTVAVGDLGTIQYSADRRTWKALRSGDDDLNAIAYGSGRFVAVGDGGTVLASPDGVKWDRRDVRTGCDLNGVFFGGVPARFIAVGKEGCMLTSPNGADWSLLTAPSKDDLYDVAYGNGRFVAAGEAVATSTDGKAWIARPLPPVVGVQVPQMERLAFGNGRFAGIGPMALFASANGEEWTVKSEGTGTMDTMAFGNGHFVALGHGQVGPRVRVWTSDDGIAWKDDTRNTDLLRPDWFAFVGGAWLGVGQSGRVVSSRDGSHWERLTQDPGASLRYFAEGPSGPIALSWDGGIFSSADGQRWNPLYRVEGDRPMSRGLAYGSGRYVAIIDQGDCDCPAAYLSADGSRWTKQEVPFRGSLGGIAYRSGLFFAPAGDGVWSSPDGREWTRHQLPADQPIDSVAAVGDLLVASDRKGTLFTSTDGVTWTKRYQGRYAFEAFAYGNGRYIAVNSTESLVSVDGVTWTAYPMPERGSVTAVAYGNVANGNGLFVVVGAEGFVLVSADGQRWTKVPAIASQACSDVIYSGGRFILAGWSGVLTVRF